MTIERLRADPQLDGDTCARDGAPLEEVPDRTSASAFLEALNPLPLGDRLRRRRGTSTASTLRSYIDARAGACASHRGPAPPRTSTVHLRGHDEAIHHRRPLATAI
jgi:hypothetical protein